ncbi:putative pre-mRNA splicing factor prp1 [Calocera cornea HHB12733]|uniref:Putative pre-mRNA splicing factor prp1 n=1 Tax=Calocera cornea HHB12733 TaxID=1353952 RepID=A0A165ETK9_9BASI|nr:putative pre-mRNA splicing factor prp1 [Calocera cornea HHB12733]
MPPDKPNKLAFLAMPAPAAYVAGLGRGASGFTTRSDIGPAREGPTPAEIAEAQAKRGEEPDMDSEQFQDPDNEIGLFAGGTYEADDEEADKIYDGVDARMDARRKARREAREQEELSKFRSERPKLQQQFADLKRGLSAVSDVEWENLPEVSNLTGKKRKLNSRERTYAVPDSVLVGNRDRNEYVNALDAQQQENGGFDTPAGGMQSLVDIGAARDKVLSLKLDQVSGTASTSGLSSSIDPKGYLTSLESQVHKTAAEIGDIKKARSLFESLIKSNPKHAPGWIAAAALEEHAGHMVKARKLIKQGCEMCPKSEDVWLEAARLHAPADAKVILAEAVQHISQSVKIWLTAADLEQEALAKKRVLRKALEHIPNSVRLWKETVNLETNPADARILLARAVELIPSSVELWLALARLEVPARARQVINKARLAVPTSHEIWIAACRLMEQEGEEQASIDRMMAQAVLRLRNAGLVLKRDMWLDEAEKAEGEGAVRTCVAIIRATVALEVEEDERYDRWLEDVEAMLERGKVECARAVLAYALKVFPDRASLWRRAADLEKEHGTRQTLEAILVEAVKYCPQAEVLWLMAAKEKWLSGDVPTARRVLAEAFAANPRSERIWLAAVKLEAENGEIDIARQVLEKARAEADTERIWMKSAVFERQTGNTDKALEIVNEAIRRYDTFDKLYMIKGQIYIDDLGRIKDARETYEQGRKKCPKSIPLWILSSRLEEKAGITIKARSLLDRARLVNPKNPDLWAESIRVEERAGLQGQAKTLLAKALQDCPSSGVLWSMAIWAEPRASRKRISVDAIKKCNDDPLVILSVARMFYSDRSIMKARQWFERAVTANPDLGDAWAWYVKFARQYGTEGEQNPDAIERCKTEAVVQRAIAAEPHHGEMWQAIAKDMKHSRKSTAEILEMVVASLE